MSTGYPSMSSGGVRGDEIDTGDVVFEWETSGALGATSSSSMVREVERGDAAGDGEIYGREVSLEEVGRAKGMWEVVETGSAVDSDDMTRNGYGPGPAKSRRTRVSKSARTFGSTFS